MPRRALLSAVVLLVFAASTTNAAAGNAGATDGAPAAAATGENKSGAVNGRGGHDPATSLPAVTSGARPGPPVLYSKQPKAPELENHDPRFRAAPLLVSVTEGYVQG